MKGTEKIIAHIQADASEQASAILAQAEDRCKEIRADYDAKAAEAYAEAVRLGVRGCEEKAESVDRIAQMEAKKGVLSLKQEMVSRSFSKAVEKIISLPDAQYSQFLAKLACSAASVGDEEIVLNERDRNTVGEAVIQAANAQLAAEGKKGGLKLSDKTGSFAGGLIMKRGNIEVNCTVELLVDLCRGDMSAELAKVLFA